MRTTLDLALQEIAANVVKSTLAKYGSEKHAEQAALVAMRPDGAVVAMIGGRNYTRSKYNRAVQAERQPGSAFKLFDYYAALRQRLYARDTKSWTRRSTFMAGSPRIMPTTSRGEVTLAEAFANSLNDAARPPVAAGRHRRT